MSFLVMGSSNVRPIRRLIAKNVRSGLVTPWRLAGWPTRRSPSSVNATIDGVVRAPSEFSMTLGVEPSITATHELVVPRSMPITFAIALSSSFAEPPSPEAARPKEGSIRRSPRPPQATGPRQTVYEFPRRSAGCGVYKGAPTGLQGAPPPLIFRGKASGFRRPAGAAVVSLGGHRGVRGGRRRP